ncbi:unnamed protein product [Fraxinus pennsylvanica]|uniref:RNase H type-1 domain-containing protein n=1 Tax=Fraxinus pennsylvanica TaxID=56036 RepID=A0AAD2E7G7_9LAMI|nr:unnamed protein product [Fraxinus pennsylvanica]
MEGRYESVEEAVTSIKFWLQQMASSINKVNVLPSHDARILSDLDIPCVMQRCGGVIRDEFGKVMAGFTSQLGEATNTEVELRAIIEGLKIHPFEVHPMHQYMEGNQVTGTLAKLGAKGHIQRFYSHMKLSKVAHGLVRLDRLGVAYIRS